MIGDKVWLTDGKGVKIVTLTDDRLDEALQLMREAYYVDEPVALGTRLQECPEAIAELEKLTLITYKDGVSLAAILEGKLLGVLFNKIQAQPSPGERGFFEQYMETCKTETAKEYMNLMIRVDSRKDVYDHFKVSSSLEVMFLATARSSRQRGVGKLLVAAAEKVAREHHLPICSAIYSNIGSQRIGTSLGWELLVTAHMSEFYFQGRPYSEFTGDNQTMKLMAHRVE